LRIYIVHRIIIYFYVILCEITCENNGDLFHYSLPTKKLRAI